MAGLSMTALPEAILVTGIALTALLFASVFAGCWVYNFPCRGPLSPESSLICSSPPIINAIARPGKIS
jgi:hypothetical protein